MLGFLRIAALNLLCVIGGTLLVLNAAGVLTSFEKPLA